MIAGALFTEDYLKEGVVTAGAFAAARADAGVFREAVRSILADVGDPASLNEAQTEDRIIRPILDQLGWGGLRVVQAAATRADVPDYLLFPDEEAFRTADPLPSAEKFRHAVAVSDAKKWTIGLDQRGGGAGFNETPAGQMLRYMDRAAARSATCRWGVLTNGRRWRLYWQGAADRLGRFFEVDLLAALGMAGEAELPLFAIQVPPDHALALFILFFRREGFGAVQTAALNEGKLWETKVREDLARIVFRDVYPGFIRALIEGDPQRPEALTPAYLAEVREAALTLLYRLLFALYAEDRDLLPKRDRRFDDYALTQLRKQVAERADRLDVLSARAASMWGHVDNLVRMIDAGDDSLGLPPYNGGLFAESRSPLLRRARVSDRVFAPLLDALSRREEGSERKWINYRDLSVRELGSIYERLLEHEPVADAEAPGGVAVRLNPFARKGSGSYYTPDVLVRLIIERTLGPLVKERLGAFEAAVARAADGRLDAGNRRTWLNEADPGSAILALKVCDPAMGSGHFLVDLVDWLSAEAFKAIGGAEEKAAALGLDWRSPLAARLEALRCQVRAEADQHGWAVGDEQLTDANLIKRLVLKRCVYGVDKNPMAVELAKVALWLHTFTAGAPLSFLDHHLRCGDSLFGEWVDVVARQVERGGQPDLFVSGAITQALTAERAMRTIESLSDGVLSEAEQSAAEFDDVREATRPLAGFLDFWHALRWLKPDVEDRKALDAFRDGAFGDPVRIAAGLDEMRPPPELTKTDGQIDLIAAEAAPEQISLLPGQASARDYVRVRRLLARARALAAEQRFLHWQVAFPGVWSGWRDARTGGFDAVIGNPPWDRMKMQEVEWFAERKPEVARQARAADRKAAVAALRDAVVGTEDRALADAYDLASSRAETAMAVAREKGGAYPLLSRGDINLYSLFVERAQALIRPEAAAGLLVPSAIMSGKETASFLEEVFTSRRIIAALEYFNRQAAGPLWFSDVYWRFRFCVLVVGGGQRLTEEPHFTFFYWGSGVPDEQDMVTLDEQLIRALSPEMFALPMFANETDAKLALQLSGSDKVQRFGQMGLRYYRMYDMGTDSELFITEPMLDAQGAYPSDTGQWRGREVVFDRLFEGKMVQAFDHRAASVVISPDRTFRTADAEAVTTSQHADPAFLRVPRFLFGI